MWIYVGAQKKQDHVCLKSIMGYIIMVAGLPTTCVSKLHTKLLFSTLDYEYVALSHSLIYLLSINKLLKELFGTFFHYEIINSTLNSKLYE